MLFNEVFANECCYLFWGYLQFLISRYLNMEGKFRLFFSVIKEYLIILRAIARVSYHSDCKDVILQGYVIFQGLCLGMRTMKKMLSNSMFLRGS